MYIPEGVNEVLLHACCAPCSSAIVEWLLAHDIRPIIYYFNPNIYPEEEYAIRKCESQRHAAELGIRWIDGDYNHESWRCAMSGLESEPERGKRCEACFRYRLLETAKVAQQEGITWFATTLASSRWKNLEQINAAGNWAADEIAALTDRFADRAQTAALTDKSVKFWAQNWRKGGLQNRRNELLKEFGFYNQLYCGCEFSMRGLEQQKQQHDAGRSEQDTVKTV